MPDLWAVRVQIYIIGGIVDRNRLKGATFKKAQVSQAARHATGRLANITHAVLQHQAARFDSSI